MLDMPVGTPVETRPSARRTGNGNREAAEVTSYQAYAGTASPINFNGLVRQYYLRSPTRSRATCRSIWSTKASFAAEPRDRQRRARH